MKRAGLQNIKRKLFQKDFSEKKEKKEKIVEKAIIWVLWQTSNNKAHCHNKYHISSCLKISNHQKYDEKTMQTK